MEKIAFPKGIKIYLPLILLFVAILLLMPKVPRFSYDYKKGSPWMYETLIAQFDFPILKTDAQISAEKERIGSNVIPYYKFAGKSESAAFSLLSEMNLGDYSSNRSEIADVLALIYEKGVVTSPVPEYLTNSTTEKVIYVQKGRRAAKVSFNEVFTEESARSVLKDAVSLILSQSVCDSLFKSTDIQNLIIPNLIYDQQTTDLVHERSVNEISESIGVVHAGQVIVSEGEIITSEVEQLLDSYRSEYNENVGYYGPDSMQWIGNVFIAFALVFVLFMAIYYCNYKIFESYNKYLYLLIVYFLAVMATCLVAKADADLFYMIPFTLIAMYLLAFFKKRVVFVVYILSLVPMLLFAPEGIELFMIYMIAGVVCILVFGYFNRGWLQFVTALIVFFVMCTVWFALKLVDGLDSLEGNYYVIYHMALASLLSVAAYPLIYLFEKMFRLVSNSKLVELSDTNNTLLRLLAEKAPGTFQHSLQVMNLADAAARAIGANVLLVRAGALYHDIGKIANPQCFTENETSGISYHAGLSPQESSKEIVKHVSDGLALAEKYNLPDVVRRFISTHHGTTTTGYFYTKYLNDGGDPAMIGDFQYDGKRPQTKEQVVLMVCDAVEAASRSLKDYSEDSISRLVDHIVETKAAEDQFSDSDISLRDINVLKDAVKTYLKQVYHSRVVYPKRNTRQRG